MSDSCSDIEQMLDTLDLPVCLQTFNELMGDPQLGSYSPVQFLRELLEPQYREKINKTFESNLRHSKLLDTSPDIRNLQTGNGRVYNETTVDQILTFRFAEDRLNIGVYGVTGVGKSYFLAALCVEACRRNYGCQYIDYENLLNELIALKRSDDIKKYNRRIKYYAKIQLLFIDDFAINRYPEDGMDVLYQLVKMRTDLKTSTLFSCQYAPDEWKLHLSDTPDCYGKLDGIRRRLTRGYTALIEKSDDQ